MSIDERGWDVEGTYESSVAKKDGEGTDGRSSRSEEAEDLKGLESRVALYDRAAMTEVILFGRREAVAPTGQDMTGDSDSSNRACPFSCRHTEALSFSSRVPCPASKFPSNTMSTPSAPCSLTGSKRPPRNG